MCLAYEGRRRHPDCRGGTAVLAASNRSESVCLRSSSIEIVITSIISDHIATTAFTLYSDPITLCCVI